MDHHRKNRMKGNDMSKEFTDSHNQYLVTVVGGEDSAAKQQALESVLEGLGVTVTWVTTDPDPSIPPNEYGYADDGLWDDLEGHLERLVSESDGELAWADGVPEPKEWDIEQRRRFIRYIVQEKHYLGPVGCDMEEAADGLGLLTTGPLDD